MKRLLIALGETGRAGAKVILVEQGFQVVGNMMSGGRRSVREYVVAKVIRRWQGE